LNTFFLVLLKPDLKILVMSWKRSVIRKLDREEVITLLRMSKEKSLLSLKKAGKKSNELILKKPLDY